MIGMQLALRVEMGTWCFVLLAGVCCRKLRAIPGFIDFPLQPLDLLRLEQKRASVNIADAKWPP